MSNDYPHILRALHARDILSCSNLEVKEIKKMIINTFQIGNKCEACGGINNGVTKWREIANSAIFTYCYQCAGEYNWMSRQKLVTDNTEVK